ncbi:MAG TPA: phytanoyl-CoA dioxygenase family protein, partial [Sphingomicrobium sp.]|nr:phytanoyl-CoA dioxygenase family protein [Sphingomicrobium sp.]
MHDLQPGVGPQVEQWTERLLEHGWCVIPSAVSPQLVDALDRDLADDFRDTPFCNGGFYGARTKRFGRLLARSPLARKLVQHPLILGISRRVME